MKKLSLLLLLAAVSQAEAHRGHIFVGPFAGVGITTGEFKLNGQSNLRNNTLGDTGFLGGLLVGYAYPCKWYFVGAELTGNFDTSENTFVSETALGNPNVIDKVRLSSSGQFGFAARAGVRTSSDVIFYVRVGAEWKHYEAKYVGMNGTANIRAKKSKTPLCFAPGVGIEAPVAKNLNVRLEGKYTFADEIKFNIPRDTAGIGIAYTNAKAKVSPQQGSVMVGLTYTII